MSNKKSNSSKRTKTPPKYKTKFKELFCPVCWEQVKVLKGPKTYFICPECQKDVLVWNYKKSLTISDRIRRKFKRLKHRWEASSRWS